jgi:hypothetical protein
MIMWADYCSLACRVYVAFKLATWETKRLACGYSREKYGCMVAATYSQMEINLVLV